MAIYTTFAPGWDRKEFKRAFVNRPTFRVDAGIAERFLQNYVAAIYEQPNLDLYHGKNTLAGGLKVGGARFYTMETNITHIS